MTNTDGIEYTTMHDYKPTHPPVSKAVLVAIENAADTQAEYDDYVNEMLNNGIPGIDWTELERLADIANDADRELLLARDIALNCKHENTSMTGTMTFAGEVDDNFVTVCEDCGRRVGE
jgi:hypothetical protein